MSAPINAASEHAIRTWRAERQLEDFYRAKWAAHNAHDPTEHAHSGNGAPVAYLVLAVILFVVVCTLAWLVREWISAGGWLR